MPIMKALCDDEIRNFSEKAKGMSAAQCAYYLALCGMGFDCGGCSYIYKQCYGSSGGGGNSFGGCGTCVCP